MPVMPVLTGKFTGFGDRLRDGESTAEALRPRRVPELIFVGGEGRDGGGGEIGARGMGGSCHGGRSGGQFGQWSPGQAGGVVPSRGAEGAEKEVRSRSGRALISPRKGREI